MVSLIFFKSWFLWTRTLQPLQYYHPPSGSVHSIRFMSSSSPTAPSQPFIRNLAQVLLRPRELMSPVVSGYERHNLVTTWFWAHYASGHSVGTHEVIQSAIHCTLLSRYSMTRVLLGKIHPRHIGYEEVRHQDNQDTTDRGYNERPSEQYKRCSATSLPWL